MKTICRRTVIKNLNKEIDFAIEKLKKTNVTDDYEMLALKDMKLVPSIASMNDCDGFCRICDLAKRIRGSYGNAEGMVREYQLLTGGP